MKLYTLKQVADIEDRSLRQLQREIADGRGPPIVQLGPRTFRVTEEDLKAHHRSRRKLPPGYRADAAAGEGC